jgi:hypothetical protein
MPKWYRHRSRSQPPELEQDNAPVRRNVPPEARGPEQPGTGSASLNPVAVTVRRRSQWRTRSGRIRRDWELTFEPTNAPTLDPLMGWTHTTDPLSRHKVAFHTAEAAIAFAKRKGWDVTLIGEGLADENLSEHDLPVSDPRSAIDETLSQSFPASDPPPWTLGRRR